MLRFALALAVLVPTVATADKEGPPFAVGLDYTFGHGGHVEDIDLGLRLETGLFMRMGPWQATFSIPVHPNVTSANEARDTPELTGVGISGRIAYRKPLFGGVFTLSGGVTRRWIWGKTDVMRTCHQTGECVAGAYLETPKYHAWAPQMRIGIGPEKLMPRMVMAASFEVIVEGIAFNDVPRDGIRNITVMGGVTMTIGGGPKRR